LLEFDKIDEYLLKTLQLEQFFEETFVKLSKVDKTNRNFCLFEPKLIKAE
jgi:hypothetical protein